MNAEQSSPEVRNERRSFFRIEDTVLMRHQSIDENCALANRTPLAFAEDPGYSLMHELQALDRDSARFLRPIAEQSHELESYLKALNKKLDIIAAKVVETTEHAPDQNKYLITISEGGLAFRTSTQYANDSYIAVQITLLPSHQSLVLFCRVINCSQVTDGFNIALSFVNLTDGDRQIIAKHIIQLQLAERRQLNHGD